MKKPSKSPPDLCAGAFSAWLAHAQDAIAGRGRADVPCGDCTACCQSSQFIHIDRDEIRPLSHIPTELLFPVPGGRAGDVLMGYDECGRCPMLTDQRCSIYPNRPATCMSYDCRVFPAAGILPTENENPLIAEQAQRWSFEYPSEDDHRKHLAVKAAAEFLRKHPEAFKGRAPINATRLAVLAIRVHSLFVDYVVQDASGKRVFDEGKIIAAIHEVIRQTSP